MRKLTVIFLFILVCAGVSLHGATIYANSITGNDTTGEGSSGAPYRTFHRAYLDAGYDDIIELTGTFDWTDADEVGDTLVWGYRIEKNLTIRGDATSGAIVQGAPTPGTAASRLFAVEGDYTVTFDMLTMRNGVAANWSLDREYGGALSIDGGADVIIQNCWFSNNESWLAGGAVCAFGGSDVPMGSVSIENSTFSNNHGNEGGALDLNKIIAVVSNCTICDNTGDSYGGGINITNTGCEVTITNSTIVNNTSAATGGGISHATADVYIMNTILANNTGSGGNDDYDDYSGTIHDNGCNIVEYTLGSFAWPGAGNITGNQSNLNISSTLADNGTLNHSPTLALQTGSVAINAGAGGTNGSVAVPATDQRGMGRVEATDIGAYEFGGSAGSAPIVVTDAPSGVTLYGATLHGTVNPGDLSTTTGFEYRPVGSSLTSVNADQSPISGTSALPTSKLIAGLESNTAYEVRAWATNSMGTVNGDFVGFTTLPGDPTLLFPTHNATDLPRSVTVSWRWDDTGEPTGFRVYKNGARVGSDILWDGDKVYSQQMPQAAWGEGLNWYVIAYNAAGETVGPDIYHYETMAEPAEPGEVPGTVVYTEMQNVTTTNPPMLTAPTIDLGEGNVQPTFQFTYGAAPSIGVLGCTVMDRSPHAVLFPENTGAAFSATYPAGIATTLMFNFDGANVPWQLWRWGGTNWEDLSGSAVFAAGAVTFTYTSSSRAEEEFVVNNGLGTLPVTLSSFTATVTSQNYAQIAWATHTETEMIGYNLYRNTQDDIASAVRLTTEPIEATNSASGHSYSYTDEDVDANATYHYWLESLEMDGTSERYGPVTLTITPGGQGGDTPSVPEVTSLDSAYPNPFNPSTTIRFRIAEGQTGELRVYNLRGQLMRCWSGFATGSHSVVWNGQDAQGNPAGTGIYFYRLQTGEDTIVKKMMLMK